MYVLPLSEIGLRRSPHLAQAWARMGSIWAEYDQSKRSTSRLNKLLQQMGYSWVVSDQNQTSIGTHSSERACAWPHHA